MMVTGYTERAHHPQSYWICKLCQCLHSGTQLLRAYTTASFVSSSLSGHMGQMWKYTYSSLYHELIDCDTSLLVIIFRKSSVDTEVLFFSKDSELMDDIARNQFLK